MYHYTATDGKKYTVENMHGGNSYLTSSSATYIASGHIDTPLNFLSNNKKPYVKTGKYIQYPDQARWHDGTRIELEEAINSINSKL